MNRETRPRRQPATAMYPSPASIRALLEAVEAQRRALASEDGSTAGRRRTVDAVTRTGAAFCQCGWWWRELPIPS